LEVRTWVKGARTRVRVDLSLDLGELLVSEVELLLGLVDESLLDLEVEHLLEMGVVSGSLLKLEGQLVLVALVLVVTPVLEGLVSEGPKLEVLVPAELVSEVLLQNPLSALSLKLTAIVTKLMVVKST
jgi:hypothetical protein